MEFWVQVQAKAEPASPLSAKAISAIFLMWFSHLLSKLFKGAPQPCSEINLEAAISRLVLP